MSEYADKVLLAFVKTKEGSVGIMESLENEDDWETLANILMCAMADDQRLCDTIRDSLMFYLTHEDDFKEVKARDATQEFNEKIGRKKKNN